jgi:hypothetical protein
MGNTHWDFSELPVQQKRTRPQAQTDRASSEPNVALMQRVALSKGIALELDALAKAMLAQPISQFPSFRLV